MGSAYIRPTDVTRALETTAGRFSVARFGGPTTSRTTTVSVLTTVTRVVANNPRRVSLTIYNRGTSNVDLSYTSDITAGAGIPLSASSGIAQSTVEDDGEAVIAELYGISATATSSVVVVEVMRV